MKIPKSLKERQNWITWRLTDDGRKVPLTPVNAKAQFVSHKKASLKSQTNGATGVGFVLTDDDEILVIDLDDCLDENGQFFDETKAELVLEANSFCEVSQSGRGVHIFGTGRPKVATGYNSKGLECYSQGRYVAFTGDHLEGTPEELNDITELYNRLHGGEEKTVEKVVGEFVPEPPENWEERGRRLCEVHPPAIAGENGHGTTYKLALALVRGLCIEPDEALTLLSEEYNPRCEPEWSSKELEHKVDSAYKDGKMEWGYLIEEESTQYADQVILTFPKELKEEGETKSPEPAPTEGGCHDVDASLARYAEEGLLHQLTEFILSRSAKPHRSVAAIAATTFLGTLLSRTFETENGSTPHLYFLIVGPSGSGKNQNVDPIKALSEFVPRLKKFISDRPGTPQGLLKRLSVQPSCLSVIDETHVLLRSMTRPGLEEGLSECLLKLYSSSNATDVQYAIYADQQKNYSVNFPCFSLIGMTTPESFYDAIGKGATKDGTFARMMVYELTNPFREGRMPTKAPPSPGLVAELDSLLDFRERRRGDDLLEPNPLSVIVGSTEQQQIVEFQREVGRLAPEQCEADRSVWARSAEKVGKLALIRACSRDHKNPVVTRDDVEASIDVVRAISDTQCRKLSESHGLTPHEVGVKQVEAFIREAGPTGVTKAKITRRHRHYTGRQIDEFLRTLDISECISSRKETPKGSGRPPVVYIHSDFYRCDVSAASN